MKLTSAALRSKEVSRRGTFVTVSTHYVGPALALATIRVTNRTKRTLRVTRTSCGCEKEKDLIFDSFIHLQ